MLPGIGNSLLTSKLFSQWICYLTPEQDTRVMLVHLLSSCGHIHFNSFQHLLETEVSLLWLKSFRGSPFLLGTRPQSLPWPAIFADLCCLISFTVPHCRTLSHRSWLVLTRPDWVLPWPMSLYVVNSCSSLCSPISLPGYSRLDQVPCLFMLLTLWAFL